METEAQFYHLFIDVLLAPLAREGDDVAESEPVVVTCGVDCECPNGYCACEGGWQ